MWENKKQKLIEVAIDRQLNVDIVLQLSRIKIKFIHCVKSVRIRNNPGPNDRKYGPK